MIRFAVHGIQQDANARDFEAIALRTGASEREVEEGWQAYFTARDGMRLDPEGRSAKHTHIEEDGAVWRVAQVLVDGDAWSDWELRVEVDLAASRAAGEVILKWVGVAPVGV